MRQAGCGQREAPLATAGLLVSTAPFPVWRGILWRMKTRERRNSKRSAPSRSIWIGNHRTSVRLEPTMWAALNDIAAERGKTVHDVILEINRDRKGISLTAAIRVYIVEYYREALDAVGSTPRMGGITASGNLKFRCDARHWSILIGLPSQRYSHSRS